MTRAQLSFLRSGTGSILEEVVNEHARADSVTTGQDENHWHFDNSRFTESINHINAQYTRGVVAGLNPNQPNPVGSANAFGFLLHAVQDFYSHTNWVDFDPTRVPLFDTGTGQWAALTPYGEVSRGTNKMIVIEGLTPPAPITAFAKRKHNEVERLVDVFKGPADNREKIGDGLVSGSWFLGAGPLSPPDATIPHGFGTSNVDTESMNKDDDTRTNYQAAYDSAAAQTAHEWERLLNLTHATHGYAGTSVAMGLMVDPAHSVVRTVIGRPEVTVAVTKIRVLDDTDARDPGELNFAFTLYSADFVESVRNEVKSLSIESGNEVPRDSLPAPLTLGANSPRDVVISLQSWDDDNFRAAFNGVLDSSDQALRGVSLDFSRMRFEKKTYTLSTRQLEVTFLVTAVPEPAGVALALFGSIAFWPAARRAVRQRQMRIVFGYSQAFTVVRTGAATTSSRAE
jgi:hypothetical protein